MFKLTLSILLLAVLPALSATTFSGRFVALPNWSHQKTTGSSTLTESFGELYSWTHASGTNANQMSSVIVSAGTLTNSQSIAIDLTSVENGFGDAVTFSTVKFMAVKADSGNIDAVEIGGPTSNRFSSLTGGTNGVVSVMPGGMAMFIAPDASGYTVGTNGNLVVENSGTNSVAYELYIGGAE